MLYLPDHRVMYLVEALARFLMCLPDMMVLGMISELVTRY